MACAFHLCDKRREHVETREGGQVVRLAAGASDGGPSGDVPLSRRSDILVFPIFLSFKEIFLLFLALFGMMSFFVTSETSVILSTDFTNFHGLLFIEPIESVVQLHLKIGHSCQTIQVSNSPCIHCICL